jgi:hypothetical protein
LIEFLFQKKFRGKNNNLPVAAVTMMLMENTIQRYIDEKVSLIKNNSASAPAHPQTLQGESIVEYGFQNIGKMRTRNG